MIKYLVTVKDDEWDDHVWEIFAANGAEADQVHVVKGWENEYEFSSDRERGWLKRWPTVVAVMSADGEHLGSWLVSWEKEKSVSVQVKLAASV